MVLFFTQVISHNTVCMQCEQHVCCDLVGFRKLCSSDNTTANYNIVSNDSVQHNSATSSQTLWAYTAGILFQVTLQCYFIPKQIRSQVIKGGAGGCHCLQVFLSLYTSNTTVLQQF